MRLNGVLVVYSKPINAQQTSTLNKVKELLKKYQVSSKLAYREKLSKEIFANQDLIITVGGDGTFLRASHFIDKQLILGVNSEPKTKEGFFMNSNKTDFEEKFMRILNGKFKIKKLSRLEAHISKPNEKKTEKVDVLALNEFYIGPRKSYHAAKYSIQIGNKKEIHKSSGILVSTPAGSHAWSKSCINKSLKLNSMNYQFVVREPYEGKVFKNYKLKYGILVGNKEINITSHMIDGILVADSVSKEYSIKNGYNVIIKLSKNSLNTIMF